MKTIVIIQARMGSSRLPGKVMKKLCGKTVLEHVITRVKQSKEIQDIVIATTIHERDNVIEDAVQSYGVKIFRGSEDNVLERYYYAAKEYKTDTVIRVTSDCPLIDPFIIDEVIRFYKNESYDIVTNAGLDLAKRTYPRGLDVEAFSFHKLEEAFKQAGEPYQLEHVTPYLYEHNSVGYCKNDVNYSNYRWTLDTEEDWLLISKIYEYLYKGKHDFYMEEIVALLKEHPELLELNRNVQQKILK